MKLYEAHNYFTTHKEWNKCFCVGANKTGTSSLEMIFENLLGFQTCASQIQANTTSEIIKGNYTPLLRLGDSFDFHKDLPASQGNTYVALDAIFPKSKFILTLRDPEGWAHSFLNYYSKYFIEAAFDVKASAELQAHYSGFGAAWISHYWYKEVEYIKNSFKLSDIETKSDLLSQDLQLIKLITRDYAQRNQAIKAQV